MTARHRFRTNIVLLLLLTFAVLPILTACGEEISDAPGVLTHDAICISFDGSGGTVTKGDPDSAIITERRCELVYGGAYSLSGSFSGQIIVAVSPDEPVELILDNLTVNSHSAAIRIDSTSGATITLPADTSSALSDSSQYKDTRANACLAAATDLTIRGEGKLSITGNYNNGLDTSKNLIIEGGSIEVNAPNNAVRGNISVTVSGGSMRIISGDDGIKTASKKDGTVGNFIMTDGDIVISAADDGIQAAISVNITGGRLTISCAGESINSPIKSVAAGCLITS